MAGLLLGITATAPQAGAQVLTPPEVNVNFGLVRQGLPTAWENRYPAGRVENFSDFPCGSVATFMVRIQQTTLAGSNSTPRRIELDLALDAYASVLRPGAGFTSFVGGPEVISSVAADTPTATLSGAGLVGTPYVYEAGKLRGHLVVNGVGPVEDVVVVAQKARITCIPSDHNPENTNPPPAFAGQVYATIENVKDITGDVETSGANATGFNVIEVKISDPASSVEFSVAKAGPASAMTGTTVAYQITITNEDPDSPLFVEDFADLVGPDFSGAIDLLSDGCTNLVIPAASSATCTITMRFVDSITDQVVVIGGGNRETSNSVTTLLASMQIAKSVKNPPAVVTVGTVLTFDIVVTNDGDASLTNIVVNDPLAPASCPATTLAAGASMTCTVTYTVTAADQASGRVLNTATADSTQTDLITSRTVTVTVAPPVVTTLPTLPNTTSTTATATTRPPLDWQRRQPRSPPRRLRSSCGRAPPSCRSPDPPTLSPTSGGSPRCFQPALPM